MTDTYDDSLLCPDCGYSLRGISSDRCPECGLDITFIRENRSVIPWVNRREIGVWRAYWRTVWQVIARRKEFLREVAKPVSYREAAAFRRMTLGFVALAMGIGWVGIWLVNPDGPRSMRADFGDWFIVFCAMCALVAIRYQSQAVAALILGGAVAARLATRIRILSIYSIGSLALAPLLVLLAAIIPHFFSVRNDRTLIAFLSMLSAVLLLAMLWLAELAAISARVMQSRMLANGHTILAIVAMGVTALIVLVGVPFTIFASLVVFYANR